MFHMINGIFRVSECSFTNVTGRLIHARVYDKMSSQITVAREATTTEGTPSHVLGVDTPM